MPNIEIYMPKTSPSQEIAIPVNQCFKCSVMVKKKKSHLLFNLIGQFPKCASFNDHSFICTDSVFIMVSLYFVM